MRGGSGESANILVVVLDALREDTVLPSFEQPGRCLRAADCIASAPWTLPSCTSILTGEDASRHHHYWHSGALDVPHLVRRLPAGYQKVGLVNNPALQPSSQLNAGFDRWTYFDDHARPFERAATLVQRARRRKRLFLLLHSNISHDYYLPSAVRYFQEAFPQAVGGPCVLGDRVISWSDTTSEERGAVVDTYRSSAMKAVSRAREILELVRERDDFVTVVTSDHGEGLEYDSARVHHGGRVHDDLLRVPLYVDLPSAIRESERRDLEETLTSRQFALTELLPTVFALAGDGSSPHPNGDSVEEASGDRVVVSEDRRYLYLNDRFRLNFKGRGKHMSPSDQEHNSRLVARLGAPPVVRAYRSKTSKLVMTALRVRPATGSRAQARQVVLGLADLLLGSPMILLAEDLLLAFELFDLASDPEESHNLLADGQARPDALRSSALASSVTVPVGGHDRERESPLIAVLDRAEQLVR